jgi:two-component system, NtrC family, sensor kinase
VAKDTGNSPATLYVIRGRELGKQYVLAARANRIGRDINNDVQLHDTEVSRHHAEISWAESGVELRDLQSSNGCFVNGVRVTKTELKNGDRIQLGRTLMVYSIPTARAVKQSRSKDIFSQTDMALPLIRSAIAPSSLGHVDDSDATHATRERTTETKNRSHWEIMYHTALAVTRTSNIDDLLQQILELIFRWVECDRGCIMLVDDENGQLYVGFSKTRSENDSFERVRISKTILDYVLAHQEGVITSNAGRDQRWDNAASIVQLGIQEAICVPMQGRYGIVGAIYIDTSTAIADLQECDSNRFDEDHLKLMIAIGHQAALAIEDTNYYRGMLQAEKLAAIGQTTATISHHVKNILQGLRGGSYLVQDGIQKQDLSVVDRGWKIVEKNQDRIANLVMDMLTYSKDREPERIPSDLTITIDEIVDLMQARADELHLSLKWERPQNFPIVMIDPEALHRAILNVVTNAFDAVESRENGEVVISALDMPDKALIAIEIRDNGMGIPPADLQRVFSLFESTKGARGTGLGLPVSQKIIHEHGGEIVVASQVNEGTTFTLRLPRVLPETLSPKRRIEDIPTQF